MVHSGRVPAAEPRYCLAQVTEEARDAWRNFCDRHGVDRTAFAEVIGLWLAEDQVPMTPILEQLIRDARDLRNQRRRRG